MAYWCDCHSWVVVRNCSCPEGPAFDDADAAREEAHARRRGRGAILQALGFFKSVILSGEDWTPDAQRMFDGAVEGVRTLAAERDWLRVEVGRLERVGREFNRERLEAIERAERAEAELRHHLDRRPCAPPPKQWRL
jgi:hypothetical protein